MAVSKRVPGKPAAHEDPLTAMPAKGLADAAALADLRLETDLPPFPPSPARDLQETLSRSLEVQPTENLLSERWSVRRTTAFLLATNGSFWLAAAWLVLTLR